VILSVFNCCNNNNNRLSCVQGGHKFACCSCIWNIWSKPEFSESLIWTGKWIWQISRLIRHVSRQVWWKSTDQLAGSTWGASANTLRSYALALCYSAAEYCVPVWSRSAHTSQVDVQLNSTMRLVSGTIRSTPLPWLPVLSNIEPPALWRKAATDKLVEKIVKHDSWPIQPDIFIPPLLRLTSRKPLWLDLQPVDIRSRWRHNWMSAQVVNSHLVCDPTIRQPGFDLPRQQWSLLNRFRTEQGHCGLVRCLQKEMATYRHCSVSLWRDPDDVSHCRILSPDKTEWRLISATLCRWRRCFVAVVHDMHTRRRSVWLVVENIVKCPTRNVRESGKWSKIQQMSVCLCRCVLSDFF